MSNKKKIGIGILALVVIILFFLPTLVKNYSVNNSKELVGRQIDIGTLKYNYFTSTVKVFDFKMFEKNEQDEFTTFDTLIINLEPLKFLSNEKVIEQFYLQGLMVKTIMKDSIFNFDDLIAFHATESDTLSDESEAFKYFISNIELKDANFYFDNQNVGKETHIEDFSFAIPFIGWNQEEKSNAYVKFNFKNGGYFESLLNVNPVDGEFDALISINNLYLKPFYEYVKEYSNINDFDGQLNAKINIVGNTNEGIKSIVSGTVDIDNFKMTDTNDKEFLAAKNIHSTLQKIDYYNSSYIIDSLNINESYTYFKLDSITNNFFQIFKLDEESDTSETLNETPIYYSINSFNVQDGVLDYTDNLTGEPFNYHLSDIKVNSEKIVSDSEWVDIYSTMLLNNRGTLKAEIGFNPANTMYADLDLVIENFLLSDLNIYTNYYTGHDILQGDMYYYSQSKITNGNIESENKLLVKNVTVESSETGLKTLPLKFALWLLKDKNGDVNLEIPVRGNLNEPEVEIGKIVWNTIKNLIIKTVASPVKFLAGLVDGDPKELEGMDFSYTDTIPSEKQFRKLDKLLEMETKKEGLKIELVHYVDKKLQNEAIAFSEVGNQFNQETKKDYLKDEKEFESYLKTKAGSDSISNKEAVLKLISPTALDSLSILYNQKLLNNTQQYLQTTKDSTNIEVKSSEAKEPENTGSISRFKINYNMLEEQDEEDSINTNKNQ